MIIICATEGTTKYKMLFLTLVIIYILCMSINTIFADEIIEVEPFSCEAFGLTPEKLSNALKNLKPIK